MNRYSPRLFAALKPCLLGLSLCPLFALADSPQNEFNRFQQQMREQTEQYQQIQQQQRLENRQYQAEQADTAAADLSQICLPYHGMNFAGFTLIDPAPLSPQDGECLNEARLNRLSQDVTAAYLAKGYVHNPFRFEDDGSGRLTMRVTEGWVSKLSGGPRLNFDMLFPHIEGKPLNIKDLDQGLDQANKMPGSKVSVDVLPATNGEIELAFVNETTFPVGGFVGVDNFASRRAGRWQVKGGVQIDNPLGLSDVLYLNAAHTLKSHRRNLSRSVSLFHSMPYGYWTFSTFAAFSAFKSDIPLQYGNIEQKGRTWQGSLRADYNLHRGANHIFSLYTQLERIDSKSYFQDSLIYLQSPTLTTVSAGVNHLQLFPNGSLIADLNYERGLTWWNATPNQGRDQPEGQFNRWRGELNINYFYSVGSQLFRQTARLMGQYSQNYLPAVKQADLLGRYAVRGFNDLSQSAEKNLILQNNIGWFYQHNAWQIEPYLAFDLGIQKPNAPDATTQKALAYGIGIKAQHPHWQLHLEWATGHLFDRHQINQERSINANFIVLF